MVSNGDKGILIDDKYLVGTGSTPSVGDRVVMLRNTSSGIPISHKSSTPSVGDRVVLRRSKNGNYCFKEGNYVWAFFHDITYAHSMRVDECPNGDPNCAFVYIPNKEIAQVYSWTFSNVLQLKIQLAGLIGDYTISFGGESQTFSADTSLGQIYPNSWNKTQFSFNAGGGSQTLNITVDPIYNSSAGAYEFTYPGLCMWVLIPSAMASSGAFTIQNPPF